MYSPYADDIELHSHVDTLLNCLTDLHNCPSTNELQLCPTKIEHLDIHSVSDPRIGN